MKYVVMVAVLLTPLLAQAVGPRYLVKIGDEPVSRVEGSNVFKMKSNHQRLELYERRLDVKTSLMVKLTTVIFKSYSDDAGTALQIPVDVEQMNRCELALEDTCVAVAPDGKRIYEIKRIE